MVQIVVQHVGNGNNGENNNNGEIVPGNNNGGGEENMPPSLAGANRHRQFRHSVEDYRRALGEFVLVLPPSQNGDQQQQNDEAAGGEAMAAEGEDTEKAKKMELENGEVAGNGERGEPQNSEQISSSSNFANGTNGLVDEYFEFVAATGRPHLSWDVVKPAFLWKLQDSINHMFMCEAEKLSDDLEREELLNNEQNCVIRDFVLEKARGFTGTPFTIQRLCELLVSPMVHYRKIGPYLRALERTINVVTTVNERGERITGAEDLFPEGEEDLGAPIPVERNFIVSVDELDDPLPQPPPPKRRALVRSPATTIDEGNEEEAEKAGGNGNAAANIDECFFPEAVETPALTKLELSEEVAKKLETFTGKELTAEAPPMDESDEKKESALENQKEKELVGENEKMDVNGGDEGEKGEKQEEKDEKGQQEDTKEISEQKTELVEEDNKISAAEVNEAEKKSPTKVKIEEGEAVKPSPNAASGEEGKEVGDAPEENQTEMGDEKMEE